MVIVGVEYELKFAATEQAQASIRRSIDGPWAQYRMHTTYYDTPDGDLSARKWTLRHRLENDAHICTLKTPAGDARGEWETCAEQVEDAVTELCKLGAPEELMLLTKKGVVPVCGAAFTRLAVTVETGDAVLEVALDAGRLYAGSRQAPLCEVEVELKAGNCSEADAYAARLARRFGLTVLKESKFKRALDLRENV